MYISKENYREYIALLKQKRDKMDKGLSVPTFMKTDLDKKINKLQAKL